MKRLKKIMMTPMGTRGNIRTRNHSGVALFIVFMSLAVLTLVVSSFSYREVIRYTMAINHRDAAKAEALARGGLNISRLMLVIQGKLQKLLVSFAAMGLPLKSFAIWDALPIDSETFKGLVTGNLIQSLGLDLEESLAEQDETAAKWAENVQFETRFSAPKGGFGAFDGDFVVKFQDEDSKISLKGWDGTNPKKGLVQARLLYSLFEPDRYDPLFKYRAGKNIVDRWSLVANIYDYIDKDEAITDPLANKEFWGRSSGGAETSIYEAGSDVKPKNAYFDSHEELRLVHGMDDARMGAFGKSISIYGEQNRINVFTMKDDILEPMMRYCSFGKNNPKLSSELWVKEAMANWGAKKATGAGLSPDGFVQFLKDSGLDIDAKACKSVLSSESQNFTITSEATVGRVTKKLTLVARVVKNIEYLYYFQIR